MAILSNATNVEASLSVDTLRKAAQSENTRIAYGKGWRCFTDWCRSVGLTHETSMPEDIVRFLVTMATKGPDGGNGPLALNTLRLYRSGLNDHWRRMDSPSPASSNIVDEIMLGLAKMHGDTPRRVRALRENQVLAMLNTCGEGLHERRDASILSLGFAAALRRSELCHLQTRDLERKGSEEMMLHLRRSKTDPQGNGQRVAVMQGKVIKPILHLYRWLSASNISDGFVFQTLRRGGLASGRPLDPGDVARVVKRRVRMIGLDPRDYSGHSLRAGFVTCAAVHHARIDKIMEVTRHKNAETLLKYIRDENSFIDHAGAAFL